MQRFRHPKSGHERVLDEAGPVFVSPFAKGENWNYRTVKGKGYVMEAEVVGVVSEVLEMGRLKDALAKLKAQGVPGPYELVENDQVTVTEVDESDAMEDAQEAAYQRGWRDAVKAMWVPGATIEVAHRVGLEARRLGL